MLNDRIVKTQNRQNAKAGTAYQAVRDININNYRVFRGKPKRVNDIYLQDNRRGHRPLPADEYIEREEYLQRIDDKLNEYGVVFLHSMAGIGKSQLAISYVEKYKDKYKTVHYITYSDQEPENLRAMLGKLEFVGLNKRDYFEHERFLSDEYYSDIKEYLNKLDDRTLLVIDNFDIRVNRKTDEGKTINWIDELNELFSSINKARVIFTTRTDLTLYDTSFKPYYINLQQLSADECLFLFYRYLDEKDCHNTEAIYQIIEKIKYNTLIIKLIAAVMKNSQITAEKMLQSLDSLYEDGTSASVPRETKELYAQIQKMLHISVLNSEENYILTNMALVPHSGIQKKLFCAWCKLENLESINNLISMNWISVSHKSIYLHPAISNTLFYTLKPDSKKCCEYIRHLVNFNYDDSDSDEDPIYKFDLITAAAERIKGADDVCISLYYAAASVYRDVGLNHEAIARYKSILSITNNRSILFQAYYNLATISIDAGQTKDTLKYGYSALKLINECKQDDKMLLLYICVTLAHILHGEYSIAISLANKMEEILTKLRRPDNEYALLVYSTIARGYLQSGDIENAISYYDRALIIIKGVDDDEMNEFYKICMGEAYIAKAMFSHKDLAEALEYYRDALLICKEYIDDEGEFEVLVLCQEILIENDMQKNLFDVDRALSKLSRNDNSGNILIGYTYIMAAMIYKQFAEQFNTFELSIKYYQKAIDIIKSIQERDKSNIAIIYIGMAEVYLMKEDAANALLSCDIAKEILIKDRCYSGINRINLLNMYAGIETSEGKLKNAINTYNKILKLSQKDNTEFNRIKYNVNMKISELYEVLGDKKKASDYQENAMCFRIKPQKDIYSEKAMAYYKIGNKLRDTKYYDKAIQQYEHALQGDSSNDSSIYRNIAFIHERTAGVCSDYFSEGAIEHYKAALNIRLNKLHDEEGAKRIFLNMGNLYETECDYKAAIDNYDSALQLFGNDGRFSDAKANVYYERKEYGKAIECYENSGNDIAASRYLSKYIDAHSQLSLEYFNQGQLTKAIQLYTKLLAADLMKYYEAGIPQVTTVYNDLDFRYQMFLQELENEIEKHEKADILINILEHFKQYGRSFNKPDFDIDSLEKLCDEAQISFQSTHGLISSIEKLKACMYEMKAKSGDAEPDAELVYYKKALDIYIRNYGKDSEYTVNLNMVIADIFQDQCIYERALSHFLAAVIVVFGRNDYRFPYIIENIFSCYTKVFANDDFTNWFADRLIEMEPNIMS